MIDPGAIGTVVLRRRAAREELDEERRGSVTSRSPSSPPRSGRAAFGRAPFGRALRLIPKRGQPAQPTQVAAGCGD